MVSMLRQLDYTFEIEIMELAPGKVWDLGVVTNN